MTTQQMLAGFRRAITEYKMIRDGDKIAVGLSGGKDSLTLLKLLAAYRKFSPERFEMIAVTVDLGFSEADFSPLACFAEELGVPYVLEKTDIGEIVFDIRKESNPCALCAKMRKGALNAAAVKNGCNKVALGHHSDDFLETMLLSFFYEGRLSTMPPKALLDRMGVVQIRPMMFLEEKNIAAYARDLPVCKNPCPADKETRREYVKNLVAEIKKEIPFARDRMVAALMHPERYHLFDKFQSEIDLY